jgi:hypothetical protein
MKIHCRFICVFLLFSIMSPVAPIMWMQYSFSKLNESSDASAMSHLVANVVLVMSCMMALNLLPSFFLLMFSKKIEPYESDKKIHIPRLLAWSNALTIPVTGIILAIVSEYKFFKKETVNHSSAV